MTDAVSGRGRAAVRLAQAGLMVAAALLWAASRVTWVTVRLFDGLGQPGRFAVSGASWSTGLLPLALLSLAAAIAAVAVHGWPLRVLSVLTAAASLAAGYLAISLWVGTDVTARSAAIADVSSASVLGSDRHYAGAALTLVAGLCMVSGAVLLMRSTSSGGDGTTKYVTPATRRLKLRDDAPRVSGMSERTLWDALDQGLDPTDDPPEPDAKGR